MKINKFIVEKATLKQESGGLVLRLKKLQLGRLTNLAQYTNPGEVTTIELDGNFLKEVPEAELKDFTKLEVLTLPMNFLTAASSFVGHQSLKELDLSTNRLKLLADLSPLVALHYLDVSHNQIKYIERLPAALKVLKAGDNQLEEMGFLPQNLQVLDLNHNFIDRVSPLAQASSDMRVLNLEANQLSKEEFPTMLIILERYTKNLKELVLMGNSLASSQNYVLEILNRRQIEKLDHIIVTPYIKKAFTEIKQQRDIEQIIKETHSEYLKRIKDEVEAKERIINSLRSKQQEVERLFDEYRSSNVEKLDGFVDYCNKALLKDGKELQFEHELIKNFEQKLKLAEQDNGLQARARKRKLLEDQIAIQAAKLQPPPKKLYGKPNYKPVPSVQSIRQPSVHPAESEQEMNPPQEYERKKPLAQDIEGLYAMLGIKEPPPKPYDVNAPLLSASQVPSIPSVDDNEPAEDVGQLPPPIQKKQPSFKRSAESLSSNPVSNTSIGKHRPMTKESSEDSSRQKINSHRPSIEKSILKSKRESRARRESEQSNHPVQKPQPTSNLFAEECWVCFEQYYNQTADS